MKKVFFLAILSTFVVLALATPTLAANSPTTVSFEKLKEAQSSQAAKFLRANGMSGKNIATILLNIKPEVTHGPDDTSPDSIRFDWRYNSTSGSRCVLEESNYINTQTKKNTRILTLQCIDPVDLKSTVDISRIYTAHGDTTFINSRLDFNNLTGVMSHTTLTGSETKANPF